MAGGWGCPHEENETCTLRDAPCDPGAPRCVLEERMRPAKRPPEGEEQGEETGNGEGSEKGPGKDDPR